MEFPTPETITEFYSPRDLLELALAGFMPQVSTTPPDPEAEIILAGQLAKDALQALIWRRAKAIREASDDAGDGVASGTASKI